MYNCCKSESFSQMVGGFEQKNVLREKYYYVLLADEALSRMESRFQTLHNLRCTIVKDPK